MSPDVVNGLFELVGGILLFLNCRRLLKDKEIKGVSWIPIGFFTAWGYWNLYYYPHLCQFISFAGGIVVVVANTLWLILALWYSRKNRQAHEEV